MVVLEPYLPELALEVVADCFPSFPKHLENSLRDDSLPVFWYKDQVCCKRKYYMTSRSKLA